MENKPSSLRLIIISRINCQITLYLYTTVVILFKIREQIQNHTNSETLRQGQNILL